MERKTKIRIVNLERRYRSEIYPLIKQSECIRKSSLDCALRMICDVNESGPINDKLKSQIHTVFDKLGYFPLHWLGTKVPGRRNPKQGSYRVFQMRGRCFWQAQFAVAVGREVYPEYIWGEMSNTRHAVALGIRFLKNGTLEKLILDFTLDRFLKRDGVYSYFWANPKVSNNEFAKLLHGAGYSQKYIIDRCTCHAKSYAQKYHPEQNLDFTAYSTYAVGNPV